MGGFPSGWTYANLVGGGSTASVTVPAAPGIAHVLEALRLRLWGNGLAAVFTPQVTIADGATVIEQFQLGVPAGGIQIDEVVIDYGDHGPATQEGNALVVTFTVVAPASSTEEILIGGHDA